MGARHSLKSYSMIATVDVEVRPLVSRESLLQHVVAPWANCTLLQKLQSSKVSAGMQLAGEQPRAAGSTSSCCDSLIKSTFLMYKKGR
jgi:hypothetical protein